MRKMKLWHLDAGQPARGTGPLVVATALALIIGALVGPVGDDQEHPCESAQLPDSRQSE